MSFVTRFAKAKAVGRGGIYTFIERVTLFALRTPFVARKTFFVSIRTFFTVARKIAFTFADADMIISTNKPVRTGDALRAFSHHTQPVIPTDLTVGTGISPVRRLSALAGFTAGMEFHQSPKITDLQFP